MLLDSSNKNSSVATSGSGLIELERVSERNGWVDQDKRVMDLGKMAMDSFE